MPRELTSQAKTVSSAMSHKQVHLDAGNGHRGGLPDTHTINESFGLSFIHLSSPIIADPVGEL